MVLLYGRLDCSALQELWVLCGPHCRRRPPQTSMPTLSDLPVDQSIPIPQEQHQCRRCLEPASPMVISLVLVWEVCEGLEVFTIPERNKKKSRDLHTLMDKRQGGICSIAGQDPLFHHTTTPLF